MKSQSPDHSMYRHGIVLISICIATTHCAVIPDLKKECDDTITKSNYQKLEGRYFNNPSKTEVESYKYETGKTQTPLLLWKQLADHNHGYSEKNWSVTLKFESSRRAVAKLYQGDSLIAGTILHGRIRKGYFYRRPYFFGIPLVPLIFGFRTHRYRLAMCDGNLIVDNRWNYYFFAIAAGTKGEGYSHEIFKREP